MIETGFGICGKIIDSHIENTNGIDIRIIDKFNLDYVIYRRRLPIRDEDESSRRY